MGKTHQDKARKPADSATVARRRAASDSPDQALVEQDASNSLARRSRQIGIEVRFPDLVKKAIWKDRVIAVPDQERVVDRGTVPGLRAAVGDPVSKQRIRSVDRIVRMMSESKPPIPDFLKTVIEELAQLKLKVDLFTDSYENGWTVPITVLADEYGVVDLRLFVDAGLEKLRPRRISAFAAAHEGKSMYVVVIESVPAYVTIYAESADESVLDCAACDFLYRAGYQDGKIVDHIRQVFGLFPSDIKVQVEV